MPGSRGTMHVLVLLLAGALTAFVVVTTVGAVLDDPVDDKPAAAPYSDPGVEPGTDSIEGADGHPTGEEPPWAVVVYRSKDGRPCAAAGREVDGKVGALSGDRFDPYPIHEGGSCVDLDAVPAGAQITTGVGDDEVTVVHGIAGSNVEAIVVRGPEGTEEPAIGPRGGFVAVLGQGAIKDVHVTARLDDGRDVPLL